MENKQICDGYLRSDGQKGIRNKVLILYTVECARYLSERIARYFREKNEDVDCYGCQTCMVNQVNIRRLIRYAMHPNVGAVLVIGHGCEYLKPQKIAEYAKRHGKIAEWFYQQEIGGSEKGFIRGKEIVEVFLQKLEGVEKVPFYFSDLVLGLECGGSDFTSGLAGNALVGKLSDELVEAGGTVIFEELCEGIGLREYLVRRGINEKVKRELALTYDKTLDFSEALGHFSIAPGNMDGGLTTIEEKSMGAIAKSGTKQISGVLKIAQVPIKKGLYLLDTVPDAERYPAHFEGSDASDMMDLIASNCHLVLLVTGRGHVVGTPISPVYKITGNPRTYQTLKDDIDFCAAEVLTGEKTLDEMKELLIEQIVSVCRGSKTNAERLHHTEGMTFLTMQQADKVVQKWEFRRFS